MSATTHAFPAEILHPIAGDVCQCEVEYTMRERAILSSVTTEDGADVLGALDTDAISQLERQAGEFFAEDMRVFNSADHHE